MNTKKVPQKSVFFFTNFPPPFTGHTVINRMLFRFAQSRFSSCSHINISGKQGKLKETGKFRITGILFYINKLVQLNRTLNSKKVNIYVITFSHSTLGFFKNLLAVVVARNRVTNIVGHIHTGIYQTIFQNVLIIPFYPIFVRKVNTFVFNSWQLSQMTADYIPKEKILILENTIENDVLLDKNQVLAKIESRHPSDRLELTYISNMIPSKGYMDLAIALSHLIKISNLEFHIRFIGGWSKNTEKDEFLKYISREKLTNNVSVHGSISDRSLISKYLLESHIFILPTYYPTECQPVSIIEAMNAGNAIISTKHASIPEYVFDNVNGILVDKKAPQQITSAIIQLSDVAFWKKCATGARSTFDEKFHPDIIKKKYLDFLEGLPEE